MDETDLSAIVSNCTYKLYTINLQIIQTDLTPFKMMVLRHFTIRSSHSRYKSLEILCRFPWFAVTLSLTSSGLPRKNVKW